MKIIVFRGQKTYGPYPLAIVEQFLNQGSLLPQDLARLESEPGANPVALADLLKLHAPTALSAIKSENPLSTIWSLGLRLVLPFEEFRGGVWLRDTRFLYLAIAGLMPFFIAFADLPNTQKYYLVSSYFSLVWAMVFVTIYRTAQIELRLAAVSYLFTGFIGLGLFPYMVRYSPTATYTYELLSELRGGEMVHKSGEGKLTLDTFIGYTLGVGFHEELTKALVVFLIARRPGKLMMPQTLVVYGLMSGLAFGIREGVDYIEMYMSSLLATIGRLIGEYNSAPSEQAARKLIGGIHYFVSTNFIGNLLRLTALPLFHAAWTGIASYFIAFAALHPRKKWGLWIMALLIPATIHGIYDTCVDTRLEWVAILMTIVGFVLLAIYLRSAATMQKALSSSGSA